MRGKDMSIGYWAEFWWVVPIALAICVIVCLVGVEGSIMFAPFSAVVFPCLSGVSLTPLQAIQIGILTEIFGFTSSIVGFSRAGLIDVGLGLRTAGVGAPMAVVGVVFAYVIPAAGAAHHRRSGAAPACLVPAPTYPDSARPTRREREAGLRSHSTLLLRKQRVLPYRRRGSRREPAGRERQSGFRYDAQRLARASGQEGALVQLSASATARADAPRRRWGHLNGSDRLRRRRAGGQLPGAATHPHAHCGRNESFRDPGGHRCRRGYQLPSLCICSS